MLFFRYSCKSYDGSGPGYGGLSESPIGARPSHQPTARSTGGSTSSSSSSARSRFSSSGAIRQHPQSGHTDIQHSSSSSSTTTASITNHTKSASSSSTNSNTKMADMNLSRGHSPNFSPSRSACKIYTYHFVCGIITNVQYLSTAQTDIQTLHVHLPNHGFRMIRFDEASDVRQIINLIVNSMSPSQKTNPQSYALRLRHMLTKEVQFVDTCKSPDISNIFVCQFTDPVDATWHLNGAGDGAYPQSVLLQRRLSQFGTSNSSHEKVTTKAPHASG